MNFVKKILLSSILIMLISLASGCNSNEESAEDVLKKYYKSIENTEYEKAYECLSDDIKKEISYDIFNEYYGVVTKKSKFKGYAPGISQNVDNIKENGNIKYREAVVIPVEEIFVQLDGGNENKVKVDRMLVKQKGRYRLVRESNMKRFLSEYYVGLANKAISSENPDFEEAKSKIDMAEQKDGENPSVYYYKAILANHKRDYDGAFESIKMCIEIQEGELAKINSSISKGSTQALDDQKKKIVESISYAYNIKGIIDGNKGNVKEALLSFKKALEYFGDNQYARMNIDRINPSAN